jgi:Ca-activated chloride channel family protein
MDISCARACLGILLSFTVWASAADLKEKAAFRSNAYVVLVNASVLDPTGRPVPGLPQESFRIFQGKTQQPITYFSEEEVPLSLAVVFDTSGSMSQNISGARKALRALLGASNAGDEFCLVTFAERPELTVPWVSDEALIQNSILFNAPRGQTSMLDAIRLALAQTKKAANPRRAVLVLSDGGDNHSRYSEREIAGMLEEAGAQMYAVDMAESPYLKARADEELAGPDLLERLCERAGGRYFQAHNNHDLTEVASRVSKELRSQYILGFVPPKGIEDGRFHRVQLRVERTKGGPKLTVYWRSGYRSPSN